MTFRIQIDSPSIDSGDPADDYTNEPEDNGDRINQGAFGNTNEAKVSSQECVIMYEHTQYYMGTSRSFCSGVYNEASIGSWTNLISSFQLSQNTVWIHGIKKERRNMGIL